MRTSKYRKKIKLTDKQKKIIAGVIAAGVLGGAVFFFAYFHVENVEVMGSGHYTEDEVKEMILRGPMASNSILAPILYSKEDAGDIPYVDGFTVSRTNRNTIVISVREKKAVGCIPYLDSYIYFDRNGIFIEGDKTRDETVPFFDGIQVEQVVKNEKLPIEDTVLNTAVALSTIFAKNDMIPDHIQFDDNNDISLLYGDITVQLGKDEYLEDKMTRVLAILPQISGQKGILHMENVTNSSKTITFEAEVEEVTAENWTGGYDENGDYTGDGEYDENGQYVGPKPMTALDYALENWVGGYDEEGDYTGAGEYDADMNYVGPAPTQETIDAMGDWTGGYNEEGGFTGSGEYDREGNYVGPNPNADSSEEDESYEDYSGDGGDEYYDDSYSQEDSYDEDYGYDDSGDEYGYDDSYSEDYGYDDYSYEDDSYEYY
ncbi:MAG TPA: cell division protein FtsQ/DivIB [Candidatus Blautia excrementipullorum]|nr:cell division protein FtsQ/DivIB [Candidatus Blautia excrementipullorum]